MPYFYSQRASRVLPPFFYPDLASMAYFIVKELQMSSLILGDCGGIATLILGI